LAPARATTSCSLEYAYNTADQIQFEREESMKARGLPSPDAADALACTLAVPTVIPMVDELGGRAEREKRRLARLNAHDPMAVSAGRAEHDPFVHLA
jgi:hypothetical protein